VHEVLPNKAYGPLTGRFVPFGPGAMRLIME
jgi:hypothetical protein